jgi:nucleoside-diphosphate-sugar epimerase
MFTKKVLVTGATGFIGRQVVPILLARGYGVVAVYSGKSKPIEFASHCEYVAADLLDVITVERLIQLTKPSHLIHLAWEARPGIYWTSTDNLLWADAGIALFKAFYKNGGTRGVSSGSCAQYEWGNENPLKEGISPDNPRTLYGQAKLSFESETMRFADKNNFSYASGRIFMTYGPGEYPQKLLASIISSLHQNKMINTTDGMAVRDFMYVKDVAGALVALLECDRQGIINIASGERVQLKDLIFKIANELHKPNLINLGALTRSANEPAVLLADVTRLLNEVKYRPSYCLDTGIKEYVETAAFFQA